MPPARVKFSSMYNPSDSCCVCSICGSGFNNKSYLQLHMQQHNQLHQRNQSKDGVSRSNETGSQDSRCVGCTPARKGHTSGMRMQQNAGTTSHQSEISFDVKVREENDQRVSSKPVQKDAGSSKVDDPVNKKNDKENDDPTQDKSKRYMCSVCRRCFDCNSDYELHTCMMTWKKQLSWRASMEGGDPSKKSCQVGGQKSTCLSETTMHVDEKSYQENSTEKDIGVGYEASVQPDETVSKKDDDQTADSHLNDEVQTVSGFNMHAEEKPIEDDNTSAAKSQAEGKGAVPYACEMCTKSFMTSDELITHKLAHSNNTKPRFQCDICHTFSSRSTHLRDHMRRHTGERPYACEVCSGRFTSLSTLTVHLRTHTGEKPYQCPTCGKGFTSASCLRKHVRSHTGEKPYQCTFCFKCFARSGTLKAHVRRHTGEKPFSCTTCSRSFVQLASLHSHKCTPCKGQRPRTSKQSAFSNQDTEKKIIAKI